MTHRDPSTVPESARFLAGKDRSKSSFARGRQTFRKFRDLDVSDADAVNVVLFRNARGDACGWFIGPLGISQNRLTIPFLSKNEETRASVAVIRALRAATASERSLCLVDPEDIWDSIWIS